MFDTTFDPIFTAPTFTVEGRKIRSLTTYSERDARDYAADITREGGVATIKIDRERVIARFRGGREV